MDLVSTSIDTHIFAILALIGVMVFNLYSVTKMENFVLLHKRLRRMTPLFHFLNASVAYTGGIVAGFKHNLSPMVILMIITTIFIMILEIKRYKAIRIIKINEIELQEQFRVYAKKIYLIEIATFLVVFAISFMFRMYY